MEKRLFYREPSSGNDLPLQVYRVNTNTVGGMTLTKQDKTDENLETSSKTVVGAINEIDTSLDSFLQKPYNEGVASLGGGNFKP